MVKEIEEIKEPGATKIERRVSSNVLLLGTVVSREVVPVRDRDGRSRVCRTLGGRWRRVPLVTSVERPDYP